MSQRNQRRVAINAVWGREVLWLPTGELAVKEPDCKRPETIAGSQMRRGPDRRSRVVADDGPRRTEARRSAAIAVTCPSEAKADDATARQWPRDLKLEVL